jgi:hypothetical protein
MFVFLGLDSFFVVVGCFSRLMFGFLGLDSFFVVVVFLGDVWFSRVG